MKYDHITWMGWIINIVIFLALFCFFMLFFGEHALWWFIGVLVAGVAIGWHKEVPPHQYDNNSYFTDEDFINVKVGEWVSKK